MVLRSITKEIYNVLDKNKYITIEELIQHVEVELLETEGKSRLQAIRQVVTGLLYDGKIWLSKSKIE